MRTDFFFFLITKGRKWCVIENKEENFLPSGVQFKFYEDGGPSVIDLTTWLRGWEVWEDILDMEKYQKTLKTPRLKACHKIYLVRS